MAKKSGAFKVISNTTKLLQGVEALTNKQVMVGVPGEKKDRKEGEITNAELAYIHDKGSVDGRIPARPFMDPGMRAVRKEVSQELINAAKAVLRGANVTIAALNRVGIIATRSIKNVISAGIAPALAPSTIAGRIRRVKGKKRRAKIDAALAAGTPETKLNGAEGLFTPLIVTGQLRNAITYVLRDIRGKK